MEEIEGYGGGRIGTRASEVHAHFEHPRVFWQVEEPPATRAKAGDLWTGSVGPDDDENAVVLQFFDGTQWQGLAEKNVDVPSRQTIGGWAKYEGDDVWSLTGDGISAVWESGSVRITHETVNSDEWGTISADSGSPTRRGYPAGIYDSSVLIRFSNSDGIQFQDPDTYMRVYWSRSFTGRQL